MIVALESAKNHYYYNNNYSAAAFTVMYGEKRKKYNEFACAAFRDIIKHTYILKVK